MDHFCLRVEPFDEPGIRRQLEARGIAVGPLASRYGAQGEGPSIYLTDPQGNVVELKGPPATAVPEYQKDWRRSTSWSQHSLDSKLLA